MDTSPDTSPYTIVIEKEYYPLSKITTPKIACLMMVKDEEVHIKESLESCKGYVECFIIYDTGSTDNTINIIKEYCEEAKINLYMIQGTFVNFSISRNVSLDYADTKEADFLLLLDTSDILKGGDNLKKYAAQEISTANNAYLVCQEWWSGKLDKYYNTRLVKARKCWRYKGSVHEWMADTSLTPGLGVVRMSDDIVLYQDRTKDNNKSGPRFARDKVLLYNDHKKDPLEPRTLFYLAQTCSCLGETSEALFYYKLRMELEGFQEEKFHSYMRSGEISERLNHNWHDSLAFYMKALEHTERAEPLVKISEYYIKKNKWLLAFMYANFACSLSYPTHCILFVDKHVYDYVRWHTLSVCAYYCQKYEEGKAASLIAIKANINPEQDKKNLEFYENKLKEIQDKNIKDMTRKQYIQHISAELIKNNPTWKPSQVKKTAELNWKLKK